MKKVLSAVLMLTLLLALFAGCGKTKKDAGAASKKDPVSTQQNNSSDEPEDINTNEPEDEPEASEEEEGKVDKNNPFQQEFLPLGSSKEVLAALKDFGFAYNTKEEGKEATAWSFQYVSLGTEKIDGVDTEHIKVTEVQQGETKEYEVWFNDKWESVKYKDGEGEKTGMEGSFAGAGVGMLVQLYCNTVKVGQTVFEDDGIVDDSMFTMKGKRSTGESVDLGNGSVDIDLYDIENKITSDDRLFGLSKVNGAYMYTVVETINKEIDTMQGLRVTRAVPR